MVNAMNEIHEGLSGARVLIVDDAPECLEILALTLEELNLDIRKACSGNDALEAADSFMPDLILLDVMMPDIDGFEICRRLKARSSTREIPVIFVTSLDELSQVEVGFQAGGVDYVVKPYQKETLLARIQSHLKRVRLRQALVEKNRMLARRRSQLEETVEKRTRELRQKVQELEKRDRVAQCLLTVHKQHDVLAALGSTELFRGLDRKTLSSLASELERVFLPGGKRLIRQGEPNDSLYILLNGRLRIIRKRLDGQIEKLAEIGSGDCVGEMGVLSEDIRSASVYAIRDSNLIKLSKSAYNRFKQKYPAILEQINQVLIRRLKSDRGASRGVSSQARVSKSIALVPVNASVPLTEVAVRLTEALSKTGSALHLNADRLDGYLGEGMAQSPESSAENRNIAAWLSAQEIGERLIVYQADPTPSAWTGRCIRQADLIIIVGLAGTDPQKGLIEAEMLNDECSEGTVGKELVLLYPDGGRPPQGTCKWLTCRQVVDHHHVRLSEQADFERLGRIISGQAIGLVLSGGAVRGFAHIGVVHALRENGISVDAIGGTSMGALIAGQYAMGLDYQAMLATNRQAFIEQNPMFKYTFPLVSLVSDKKYNAMLREMYDHIMIEDLWLKYFCVSSNLTRAEVNVHRDGLLWKGVRASTSVPVYFPPAYQDGNLYVDGGVMNNLPVDIMRKSRINYVIASDVTSGNEKKNTMPDFEGRSGWSLLFNRLNPFTETIKAPYLPEVILRTMEVEGIQVYQKNRMGANLYLKSQVDSFNRLHAKQLEQIAEVGYTCAVEQIARWRENGIIPIV